MKSFLVALASLFIATCANAQGLRLNNSGPGSIAGKSVSPSTITATGTGYSIQATNGSVYAKYGVKASSIALTNGGAVNITNSLDTDQEILSLDSANTVNLGNSSGITDVRIGANVNVILNSSGGDKVGIGTASPATKLHMSSGTLTVDGTGSPAAGGALCLNAAKALSKCTSAVDASGNCTCP